ncbi:putative RND-type efflux pump membrane fusion protein [Flavihumibacter petaseus NBRC 106054]|uniref:Putative RND-type efflux pump membrane fusion protein n=2 Tax=Flavihumibacter TaxID=1004301 RepID=A0A0E9N6M6_9BACT|nr:putative RND-type efflux pump membrane fusion protein [Flavihumibacter petaseus NBRC 106054]
MACSSDNKGSAKSKKKQTYTCSMHPQIVQEAPGTCPICGMDLVPFDKNNAVSFLTLNESQVALANISTVLVGSGDFAASKSLNGRLVVDPEQTTVISSRMQGRIENLYIKELGRKVERGQPLYRIYSEQLAVLQQEFLLAVAQAKQFPEDERFRQIEKAARQKLLLYSRTPAQLDQLISAQKTDPFVIYPAPSGGVVSELMVTEGQYVAEGGGIMRLEGYDKLWVEADAYPADLASITIGQPVTVIIPGWEEQPQNMTIQFINPSYQAGSQLTQVRGSISNPGNHWQPGLQARISIPHRQPGKSLILPVNAVIREGKGLHVWLETAKGRFEPRMIQAGAETEAMIEVLGGLETGDRVVVTGAYLLNSEFILKKGADPMTGHHHQ